MTYLSDTLFGDGEWVNGAPQSSRNRGIDIVVSDHPFRRGTRGRLPEIRMPPWIRQHIALASDWRMTMNSIPKAQTSRIRRFLRRYNYRVGLSRDSNELENFYEHVLVPSATTRFGDAAVLPKKSAFLDEHRHSLLLNLMANETPVAVNLVDVGERKLSIRKGALIDGFPELKGRMDTLDYFTLLIAQLLGCETLDFGLSRPHLDDGSLRYKSKWGARLVPAGGLKADIRIVPQRLSEPVLSLLRRNRFIGLSDGRFVTRILWDEHSSANDLDVTMTLAKSSGLDGLEILVADGSRPPVIDADRTLPVVCREVTLSR